MHLIPRANAINVSKSEINLCSYSARLFVPFWPFEPRPMFVGKSRSLPKSGALEKFRGK
jgi:hypothetical protein